MKGAGAWKEGRGRVVTGWSVVLLTGWLAAGCDGWRGDGRPGGDQGRWTRIEEVGTADRGREGRQGPRGPDGLTTNAWLSVIQTELSPATLWRTRADTVRLFGELGRLGLGGPTFLAYSSPTGIAVLRPGHGIAGGEMRENWLLTGFPGAEGWEDWDSPWAVFLERRPERVDLDEDGVALRFAGEAGHFTAMPLYGYYKPPQQGREFLTDQGFKEKGLLTWEWGTVVARDPLTRLRYWAGATRRFPIGVEETVRVDARRGEVVVRQAYRWLEIGDEWGTRPLHVAPVSPTLGLVLTKGQSFPVEFSKPPFDFEIATPYGPYFGVPGVEGYEIRFQVLRYVDEVEAVRALDPGATDAVREALEGVREAARRWVAGEASGAFPTGDGVEALRAWEWVARGLPYYDEGTRMWVAAQLKRRLEGFGWDGKGLAEAGTAVRTALWQALWAYTRFSGDEAVLGARWLEWRALALRGERGGWAGLGAWRTAGVGDEAAGAIALARLAFLAGDGEVYNVACGRVARELVRMQARVRGAAWYREQQPWHSLEPIGVTACVTELGDGTEGWRLERPRNGAGFDTAWAARRWGHLAEPAVGRFLRERIVGDVGREVRALLEGIGGAAWEGGVVPIPDALVGVEGLVLGARPEVLGAGGREGQPVEELARRVLALRAAAGPPRIQRWIGDAPSFDSEAGYGEAGGEPGTVLVQAVEWGQVGDEGWPSVPGWRWGTPSGHPWSVGTVRVGTEGQAGPPERGVISPNAVQLRWAEAR